jgi:isopentenyl diphosphate isomerase/L-lactate dehydrogenase-like FMN-dependent dehydrogenase/surfactin synthase thioesterase subunit
MGVTESRTARSSPWIRTFHAKEKARARIACFPHAGGAANAFTGLSAALPDDVELIAVQYPGRQGRRAEPCAEDVGALAGEAAKVLGEYADLPLFLLGHSMGGLVAFETARLMEDQGTEVARMFASAARPPSQDWEEGDMAALGDDEVVNGLRVLGGVPEPVLQDPDSCREVLRVLRADHLVIKRYRCEGDAVLSAPITVLLADEDPKNTAEQMREWARHTRGRQVLERLSGGHFGLIERPAEAAPLLVRYIHHDLERPLPRTASENGTPADLLREILLAGFGGQVPPLSTDLTTLEDAARGTLPPEAHGYVAGTAGSGATGRANRAAFDQWRLVPRMLRGIDRRDLSVTLLGRRLPAPVLLAPVAAQAVVHPEGELATVRAAADVGLPFVLSTFASRSLEEAAAEAGALPRWFQLYLPADRAVGESLVRRAEENGYTALVVTVDTGNLGFRPAELDTAYSPFLRGVGIANFTADPAFRAGLPEDPDGMAIVGRWAQISTDPTLTWEDLAWLRGRTTLPILVKGILHPDDARRALDWGAEGVVVSNHGARQLDGGVAALDALPAVRAALGPDVPVLMDSGVRTGSDVLKALALGADAVLYGRPYVYGLGLDGRRGVEHVLRCLLADVDLALALTGCADASDVGAELIVPAGPMSAPPGRPPGTRPRGFRPTSTKEK